MNYKRIGFIGLGLIGGSLAKTIKRIYPETTLLAIASNDATVAVAHRDGLIENEHLIPITDLASCDVIFLCSPVMVNLRYMTVLAEFISERTIITDVGSVKGEIEKASEILGISSHFIGGHPMAGSEKTGYKNSTDRLLENAYYILTKNALIPDETFNGFKEYISSLGALTLKMTPSEHDFATAAISHLPHIISASLVNLVSEADSDNLLKTIAAGGFKDITRISSSSPVMWQNICIENREEILKLISMFEEQLSGFKSSITFSNEEEILKRFSEAKEYRDSLLIKTGAVMQRIFDFYADLNDEVGGIATVAGILADEGLSIKNIGIVHNREFAQGVLHIEMYNEDSRQSAISILKTKNYTVYETD